MEQTNGLLLNLNDLHLFLNFSSTAVSCTLAPSRGLYDINMLGSLPEIDCVSLGFCILIQNVDSYRPNFSYLISNSTLSTSVRFKVMLECLTSEDSPASIFPFLQQGEKGWEVWGGVCEGEELVSVPRVHKAISISSSLGLTHCPWWKQMFFILALVRMTLIR